MSTTEPREPSEPSAVVITAERPVRRAVSAPNTRSALSAPSRKSVVRAALGEPGGQREQRRGARADAEQQAGGRVARHRERPPERPDDVEHVARPAVRQPLRAGLARQEDELDRAAVVGPDVVHGERAPGEHAGLRAADRDRDELAGPEPGGDRGGDHGHGDVRVDPAHREHGAAHLNRRHPAFPLVACHPAAAQSLSVAAPSCHASPAVHALMPAAHLRPLAALAIDASLATGASRSAAACSCRERTPISPRMMASMPCTAAARPATVVTHGTPRRTAAVLISYPSSRTAAEAAERLPEGRVHDQVYLTVQDARDDGRLAAPIAAGPAPSLCFRTILARTPFLRSTSAVPDVAQISKPRSARRLTGKTIARLSRLATETNTRPFTGSDP